MDDFLRGRNRKTASQIIAEAKASISTEGKVIIIVENRCIFGYPKGIILLLPIFTAILKYEEKNPCFVGAIF